MKNKIIFSIILSAIILTACKSEPSLIDELETSETTAPPQTVQVAQGETTPSESEGEKSYILGGETETTVSVAETTVDTEPEDKEVTLDVQKIDISGILEDGERLSNGGMFFSGNIAAVECFGNESSEIRFFDINDLTVKANITAPEGWDFDGGYSPCINGGGDVFCKIKLSRFDSEKLKDEYAALIVRNDFTTELAEGDPRETLSFPAGNHNISDQPYDIFDADSGEVIVEGFNDTETDLGFDSKWYYYMSEIDSDRFVYRTVGYESFIGFSYYNFAAGQAVDFPNSKNFLPVGYHDGKVYAEECGWASMCLGELYTFDMETLESEHFMSSPAELGQNDYTEYYMPPNGEYIIASCHDEDNEDYNNSKNIIFIISPDSGEVLAQQEFSSDYNDCRFFTFIDGNKFAAFNYNTSEVVIFNATM